MKISIDFETRSLIDLKLSGAYRYAEDKSTTILCIAYAVDNEDPILWTPGMVPPIPLIEGARDPNVRFGAFNVGFERRIWHFVLHKRMGWPDTTIDKWYDSQADAFAMGFPGDLKRCARALGVHEQKDAEGTRLITKLCKPIKGTFDFREKLDFHDDYLKLYRYCQQDVRTERDVANALYATTESGQERRIWAMTERINDRGVPVDSILVRSIHTLIEERQELESEEMAIMTDGEITTGNQIAAMNKMMDYPLPNFQADTLKVALRDPLTTDKDRKIMEFRRMFSNTSTSKFFKMMVMECSDGTIKDLLQYHGAAPGRYAGRGIQPQNFPRMTEKDPDAISIELIDPNITLFDLEEAHGSIMDLAKSMLRPVLCAPRGYKMICRDYGQVEARGTAWTTKDNQQLRDFVSGKKVYEATAALMYQVPYEDIEKGDERRTAGKVAVLACGYQGGWKALRDFAARMGIHWTPQEAAKIVRDFRKARPNLVSAWRAFEDAAMDAIRNPGVPYQVHACQHAVFRMYQQHLSLELPNRKKIWFPLAKIEWVRLNYVDEFGETKLLERMGVTHKWVDNHIWTRRSIHGGSLFQSYVQAICRELLMEAQLRLEDDGWPLILSVHDEVVALTPDSPEWDARRFEQIMTEVPEWATGFPIVADGWEGKRFRK